MSILQLSPDGDLWVPAEDGDFLEDQVPGEGDIITDDYIDWFMDGKRILRTLKDGPYSESADDWRERLMEWMEREQWWPNVWFVSDHGNSHLVDMGRPATERSA